MSLINAAYTAFLRIATAGRGLAWKVDERTTLRIDPRCRWIRHPEYEAAVVDYLRGRIGPGDCCIDVGGHVGFYVLQMAHWTAPAGRVIAFEPNPAARAVLRSNVKMNGLTARVTIEHFAAGASPGTGSLVDADTTSGLSRLVTKAGGDAATTVRVPVIALDQYCEDAGVRPDWILIDTEGAELSVLRGARRLLTHTAVQVVVEMHSVLWDSDTTAAAFEAFLAGCNRAAVPITGQGNPLADYGQVALLRTGR